MTEYLYFQTLIQFRVPINGGNPEILKKFTTEIRNQTPKKKTETKGLYISSVEEITI